MFVLGGMESKILVGTILEMDDDDVDDRFLSTRLPTEKSVLSFKICVWMDD
jgi:hypothetical protein